MRKFDIITDSSCDMPKSYLQEKNIACVKLGFTLNNVNYEGECGESISEAEFYQKLRNGAMPTTYQVTGESAKAVMRQSLEKGRDVFVVAFSSGLSGTAGSFIVASRDLKEEYPNRKIEVVDSLCASMGEGLLLDYVVKKADSGASIEETKEYAEDLKLHICHHFTVDNLFHLKRGGRVSGATAIVGSILKIKPIMHVNDEGKLIAVGKTIGRKKSLHKLVENMLKVIDQEEDAPIFISHGDCLDEAEELKALILEKLPKAKVTIHYVGSVIGSHSGCGTLALFHRGKTREVNEK